MASPALVPDCSERDMIISQIRNVIAKITEIHNRELDAAMAGEPPPNEEHLAFALKALHESRNSLMEKLIAHRRRSRLRGPLISLRNV